MDEPVTIETVAEKAEKHVGLTELMYGQCAKQYPNARHSARLLVEALAGLQGVQADG